MTADRTGSSFDIVIVGAGPAGLTAAAQAARRGISHVVLDRAQVANTIVRYQKGKHVMAEPAGLPLHPDLPVPFAAGSREWVIEQWRQALQGTRPNLRVGPASEVVGITGERGAFRLTLRDGSEIKGQRVVIAIGMQGNLRRFGVPGEGLPHVTYQLDDPDEHFDKRIVVVGVGDAGIENALALAKQNHVSIANRGHEFERAKPANRALIEAAIRAGRIVHYPHASVLRIEEGAIVLATDHGEVGVPADLIIGRLGATPPRKFLESVGVEFPSSDPAAVPHVTETYESNVPGLHLIGSVVGYPLIKNCMNQGYEVVEHILGNPVVPADEPLLAEKFARLKAPVNEVIARIRATVPLFRSLTTIQLREFLVDSLVHMPESGAIIFRRNEFSDSVYSILQGNVEVVCPESDAAVDTVYGADDGGERRYRLGQGDFFGELSLLSGRRRAATVIAGSDCIVIETPRLSMSKLLKSVAHVKRVLDETFIVRKLQTTLPPDVPLNVLQDLAKAAVIEAFNQGQCLFEQGAPSDGVHVIRRGSVSVSHKSGERETTIAYVPAGNIVGEMALFSPEHKRTATVRATVLTETIRLPIEVIYPLLERFPAVRSQLREVHSQRLVENISRGADVRTGDVVGFLMSVGAGEATDMLLIDESLCIRCDNCEKACAETHGGVSRLDRDAGPTFASVHVPTSCRHCENPRCMIDCPPDALRRHPNGEVFIMDNCIGCGNCAANCPYGVIQMAALKRHQRPSLLQQLLSNARRGTKGAVPEEAKTAVKCDLCRELPSVRRGGPTACVASCPTGAIIRVNPKTYVDTLYGAQGVV